ncbi:PIG-L family deacetylase [Caballeronia sp. LZ043]|uniref:PIG-L deacetylase family protein n=1 Tax=Caballeronia sp. LZ043 TaxID=3038569 RepID=UPI0028662BEB|nr:PIG-L family deacetylase [Caballeronia sp. LZ043]MDR5821608.1 PIG-L family deacetylase [Caballeronia sp. LZ043]
MMQKPPRRLLVISPHLDDAVFSCGALLAAETDALVCTVFAGTPEMPMVTGWDTECGFGDAHQAMEARRAEDIAALEILGARARHLSFLDSQYAEDGAQTLQAIADALADVIHAGRHDAVLIPAGLFHSDHDLVHRAALAAGMADASQRCIAYEDGLYRRMDGLVQQRLAALQSDGMEATPWLETIDVAGLPGYLEAKQRAVQCYASQLRAFGPHGYDDVLAPERFWTLRTKHRDA